MASPVRRCTHRRSFETHSQPVAPPTQAPSQRGLRVSPSGARPVVRAWLLVREHPDARRVKTLSPNPQGYPKTFFAIPNIHGLLNKKYTALSSRALVARPLHGAPARVVTVQKRRGTTGSVDRMDPKDFTLSPELHRYVLQHSLAVDAPQQTLIDATAALGPIARMQIAPEQGAFMQLLAATLGARLVVEVGTFTGYSTLCLARGVGAGGRVIACDVSDEWTSVGRPVWAAAGVDDRIDLRLAPALETIAALPADDPIDLAFIDADKGNYLAYYEGLLPKIRSNGVVLVDNVLWSGAVVDPAATDADTEAIRAFNDHVAQDARVEAVVLPIADGLTFIRKR
jgi:caffeoyl-CoA O-methyltransferase